VEAVGLFHVRRPDGFIPTWGSATLVQRGARRTALVLTNLHVVESAGGFGSSTFGAGPPAVTATVKGVVASSATLDYALVEVVFPPGARRPAPAHLSRDRASDGRSYSTGFDGLHHAATHQGHATFHWAPRDEAFFKSIPGLHTFGHRAQPRAPPSGLRSIPAATRRGLVPQREGKRRDDGQRTPAVRRRRSLRYGVG
jgi:hypothetical protein